MPETLKRLIDIIAFLPGIGDKTGAKLAFFLLKANHAYVENFSRILHELHEKVIECQICHGMTDRDSSICTVCSDVHRDQETICVVEDYLDMVAIERIGIFRGLYHVLGGSISPIHGVMPANLTISHLFERLTEKKDIKELILAMNPNIE